MITMDQLISTQESNVLDVSARASLTWEDADKEAAHEQKVEDDEETHEEADIKLEGDQNCSFVLVKLNIVSFIFYIS